MCFISRNEASHLGHNKKSCHLRQVRRFSSHIGSIYDHTSLCSAAQLGIIRHVLIPKTCHVSFDYWVPTLGDVNSIGSIIYQRWPDKRFKNASYQTVCEIALMI